jgi:trk system potassium uptake protein TrkH
MFSGFSQEIRRLNGCRFQEVNCMNIPFVVKITGVFLSFLGVAMLIPAGVDFIGHDPDWKVFALSGLYTVVSGMILYFPNRSQAALLNIRESYLLIFLSWVFISIFGAVPFYFCDQNISMVDAFFETVSGLTTTGATIFSGLDNMPPGILIWRAILQWTGGIGVIVLAVGILPFLGVGGMRMFRIESSDQSEKPVPRIKKILQGIMGIYIGLTIICTIAYYFAGMTGFEAWAHSLTTVSTGGFSTKDASMGYFPSPVIHWIAIIFMILGSLPFVLYFQAIRGKFSDLFRDEQVRYFLAFLGISTVGLTLYVWQTGKESLGDTFNHVMFHVTSIVTTTGFTTTDYSVWGTMAFETFFLLTFVGGCSGSTSGGIKFFRFQIIFKLIRMRFRQLINPTLVASPKFNQEVVTQEIRESVTIFFCFYIFVACGLALALSALNLDFITSVSAAATTIGNVGPGLGDIIGPAGNFQSLPDSAKWILCFGMLAGRLELYPILMIFTIRYWDY